MESDDQGTIGELIGLLAHDIRNPLAALSSNVGFLMMVGTELSEDMRETLVDLQLSLEVLGRITDTMEVLSQELRNQPKPAHGRIAVGALLEGMWPSLERAAQSHGVKLLRLVPPDLFVVSSDPSITRALVHLIYNAISLAPARSTIELSVAQDGGEVIFSIKDDGPLLGADFRALAFTKSGQLVTKSKSEGRYSRGLGLYMAGRTAELAEGKLSVETSSGKNVFVLRFQAAR